MHNNLLLQTEYKKYEIKFAVATALQEAKKKLLDAKSVLQLEELKCRKRVLRRLGYSTNTDVIQLKGRVACELSRYDFYTLHRIVERVLKVNLSSVLMNL